MSSDVVPDDDEILRRLAAGEDDPPRRERAPVTPVGAKLGGKFELTDLGNGRRLAAECGADLRYAADRGTWLVYDNKRWIEDSGRVRVEAVAKSMVRIWAAAAASYVGATAKPLPRRTTTRPKIMRSPRRLRQNAS